MPTDQTQVDTPANTAVSQTADAMDIKSPLSGDALLAEVNHRRTALLCTLHKSGTHWTRYLFTNYFRLLAGEVDEPVTYKRMQRRFGNNRLYLLNGKKTWVAPGRTIRKSGLRDFLWQHFEDNLTEYNGSIIFQYRNPLDALVSRYHYDHDRWQAAGRDVSSPMACLFAVEEFAQKFARMREIGQKRPRTLMVTYENLKSAPCEVFETMVGFVGVPINRKLIERAVAFSDITVIRKEEEDRGRAIVSPTTEGVFTRDGSIGQWKSYFSPADVNRIEEILSKHDISLDEFSLG